MLYLYLDKDIISERKIIKRSDFRFLSLSKVNNKLDFKILINPWCGKKSPGIKCIHTKINIYQADLRKFIHKGYLADRTKGGKKNIFTSIIRLRFLFKLFLFLSNQERRIFIDQKSPRLFVQSLFFLIIMMSPRGDGGFYIYML